MKISKLSLAVGLVTAMAIQSAQAGLPGTGYVGARLGYAFLANEDLDSGFDDEAIQSVATGEILDSNFRLSHYVDEDKDGWGIGIYGGYNFTEWFALEGGINYFDGFELKANSKTAGLVSGSTEMKVWGPEIAGRFAYTFDDKGSDVYGRIGLAYLMTKESNKGQFDDIDGKNNLSPLIGVGVQYAFTRQFSMRAGFDYYFNALEVKTGELGGSKYKADLGFVYLGAQFNFGGSTPVTANVPVPQQVQKTHTLDAATLFPFNGDKLSAAGQQKVAEVVSDSHSFENVSYEVYGYTDRLGSDAYNQALSERRAAAVAAELRQNGVNEEALRVVEGRGKANPVTGDRCDNVGGRRALIDCLQPDRRVEVVVSGLQ
ncbi:MAG: outer membrane beta-barrel protein [Succinivibrio sp.]|nr:outer membrane beta-barrel protein [Succinivibrio sp.]